MQIALTKKLADALKFKLPVIDETINPLFSWTANWTKVWDNRRREDMLVLVNNATRFTVAIYQVKQKDLKNVAEMMKIAISNTLLSLNLNPEMVNEYMSLTGEVEFVNNSSRQTASWVSKAGLECAFHVGREYNGVEKMFSDTVGSIANYSPVNCSGNPSAGFIPFQEMLIALSELTGKQPYKYCAFELLVTLNLEIYKAERRLIVPAKIEFSKLHIVLQSVYGWENYHLYDFVFYGDNKDEPVVRIVPFENDLEYAEDAILMEQHTLSEFLPKYKRLIYTYDMGDNWEHEIRLIRVIEEYNMESPYLLEASGQAPPEDVGGVGGFLYFREVMMNSDHPEYANMKEWARFWTLELSDWKKGPKVIHI
ncbi:plasmid pRiA4b ORF-3 family protein [Eubacteriaceae bacterium ES2]|nr:plasmid pRiA4b ORF-3 family protein [Eubacteriaceae bacterium ES2]